MTKGFTLEVVTPSRLVMHEENVEEVSAPGHEGYFTALPEHTPYLVLLSEGVLSYRQGSKWGYLAVMGGFVEVLPDRITVLAEKGERADEIDLERVTDAMKRAKKRLADTDNQEVDFDRAQLALQRALIRMSTKNSVKY